MKKILAIAILIIGGIVGYFFYSSQSNPYRQKQAVTELTCFKDDEIPQIESLGNGKILTWNNVYNEETEKSQSSFQIIDIVEDKILHTLKFDKSCQVKNIYPDKIILESDIGNFEIYDFELKKLNTIDVDYGEGFFNSNLDYYYLDHNALFVLNTETKESQQVQVENNMRFSNLVGIYDHYLICNPNMSYSQIPFCIAVVDLNDGKLTVCNDKYSELTATNHFKFFTQYDDKDGQLYHTYNVEDQYYTFSESLLSDKMRDFYYIPNTSYFCDLGPFIEGDLQENEDLRTEEAVIYKLGETITSCHLKDYGYNHGFYTLTYLEDENLIVGYHNSLIIIDPTYLNFDNPKEIKTEDIQLRNQEIIDQYRFEPKSTVKGLNKAKKKVKELEETYHIHFMLSTDCKNEVIDQAEYTIQTTNHYDNEEELILQGLKDIESALKLYPQDFFKQLKTRAGDGGLYIYLVGGIDGDFSAVAYEFSLNNSENVVVNINEGNLKATFCHEVWHAIENVIVEKDGTALDDWEQYNPPKFKYREIYNGYDEDNSTNKYTYFGESNMENVYFIDAYARTFGKEDRARIVEYFMTWDKDSLKQLKKSPHIMKKIKKINEIINENFNITFEL